MATQTALVELPTQQAATMVTYAQPITIPAMVPTQPMVTASEEPQQFPKLLYPMYNHMRTMSEQLPVTYTPRMVRFRVGREGL